MFGNMKISMKLGVGFAFALALLITISTISVLRIGNISTVMTDVFDRRMPELSCPTRYWKT